MPPRLPLLAVLLSLAASAKPADACKGCKPPTEAQLVADAARVFAGKVIAVDKSTITIEVDTIWKGSVAKQEVHKTTCWLARKPGAKLILLDRQGKLSKWVSECLEVVRDTAATRDRIGKLAGAPHAP